MPPFQEKKKKEKKSPKTHPNFNVPCIQTSADILPRETLISARILVSSIEFSQGKSIVDQGNKTVAKEI